MNDEELTNLSLLEKNTVCDILIEHGIPVSGENKDDFQWIREEMNKRNKICDKNNEIVDKKHDEILLV